MCENFFNIEVLQYKKFSIQNILSYYKMYLL